MTNTPLRLNEVSEREADRLWDINDVAEFLKCSVRHVRELSIPRARHGKKYVYDPADVKIYNSKAKNACHSPSARTPRSTTRISRSKGNGFLGALAQHPVEKLRRSNVNGKRPSVKRSKIVDQPEG
jgi:hypothetical protein